MILNDGSRTPDLELVDRKTNTGEPFFLKGTSGITSNMIYRIVKDVVSKAADVLEHAEPHKATKLRKASTHWYGTMRCRFTA